MPAEYAGKTKLIIPSIDPAREVACILVVMTVWNGPTEPGRTGKHDANMFAIPVGQARRSGDTIIPHRYAAVRAYDPKTGEVRGSIAKSVVGFHDAIGKRLSYGKPPL